MLGLLPKGYAVLHRWMVSGCCRKVIGLMDQTKFLQVQYPVSHGGHTDALMKATAASQSLLTLLQNTQEDLRLSLSVRQQLESQVQVVFAPTVIKGLSFSLFFAGAAQ